MFHIIQAIQSYPEEQKQDKIDDDYDDGQDKTERGGHDIDGARVRIKLDTPLASLFSVSNMRRDIKEGQRGKNKERLNQNNRGTLQGLVRLLLDLSMAAGICHVVTNQEDLAT